MFQSANRQKNLNISLNESRRCGHFFVKNHHRRRRCRRRMSPEERSNSRSLFY
jgi:hypothetical protein